MAQEEDTTPVAIYALCDPQTGEIRYIGQARDPERRLNQHIRRSGARAPTAWVSSLHQRALVPVLRVLETVPASRADEAERAQIAAHLARGCHLTNTTHNPSPPPPVACSAGPDEVQLTLRLTPEQHARLKELAQHESRSLHGQIIHFLNEGIRNQGIRQRVAS